MDTNTIYAKLNKIFRDVFDDDSITVNPKTTADDIDDWDSLEHITLISAVEREFKMKFKMGEISSMKNVGEMADIIAARTKL
ncbi:MAG: acyl carrier protein [Clostridia bacterium]|nr:acyl carrier protein [Clostridia bacterium]